MQCKKCEQEAIFEDPEVLCKDHWAEHFAHGDADFQQEILDGFDGDLLRIIDWARLNTEVTHDAGDLIVGKKGVARYRIFPTEGWAGIIREGGNWKESYPAYTLDEFKELLAEQNDS